MSSLWVMARMLFMRCLPRGGGRGSPFLRWSDAGRSLQGSCASAAAPAGPSRGRRSLPPARAVRRGPVSVATSKPVAAPCVSETETPVTPAIAASAVARVGTHAVDLHVHRPGPLQPRRQVVRRVDGDDAALIDDDDPLAGLADLGQDVRAEDDRVLAAQLLDQAPGLDDLLRVEAGGRLVEDEHIGLWISACARPTRCR